MLYTWANAEQTSLKCEYDNGETWYVSVDSGSPRYAEFLASGVTAAPYVAPPTPPEPTAEEKLKASGLTVDELKALLGL